MDKEAIDHRKRLTILEAHLGGMFYRTGESHIGISNAMKEHAESYSTELRKENRELLKAFETNKEQLMELATHATDLEAQIAEQQRTIDHWKQRCEAAEQCYTLLNLSVKHRKEYDQWQELKNKE